MIVIITLIYYLGISTFMTFYYYFHSYYYFFHYCMHLEYNSLCSQKFMQCFKMKEINTIQTMIIRNANPADRVTSAIFKSDK